MVINNMNETEAIGKLMEQGGGNFIRLLLQRALQELIDAEAAAVIGAGKYERSSERSNLQKGRGQEGRGWADYPTGQSLVIVLTSIGPRRCRGWSPGHE